MPCEASHERELEDSHNDDSPIRSPMATIDPRERDLAHPPRDPPRAAPRAPRKDARAARPSARIRLTTLPTDIDILRHMNNGRYLSLFDLGRWDLLIRTGLFGRDEASTAGTRSCRARRSRSASRCSSGSGSTCESRFIGHDDKALLPRAPSRRRRRGLRARHRAGADAAPHRRHASQRGAVRRGRQARTACRRSSRGCTSGPRHPLCLDRAEAPSVWR